jgi:TrfA protein
MAERDSTKGDPVAWLEQMAAEAAARVVRKAVQAADAVPASNVVQLPIWPEPARGVPNGFLRSALFGAIAKGRRRFLEREQLAAVDGIEVRYTGQRLDQGDLDVYESVLHALRFQAMGKQCRVTGYALLKLMGKVDTGGNRDTLYTYIGGLVDEAFQDEETQEWVIVLNPRLRALFEPDQFTQVEWAVRQSLSGKPLAQWLHGFYASHAQPYPIKAETLLKLAGSEDANPRSAQQTLRKALDDVAEACGKHGENFSHTYRDGLVHVEKKSSESQQRHLVKKTRKKRD